MKFIAAITTLCLMSTAFSSDENFPQMKQKMHKTQTTKLKLLGPLASHLVEAYLKPEISMKMKMIHLQWSKIKPTGFLDLIPNESSCKVFRDMEINAINWQDPDDMLEKAFIYDIDERRKKIEPILQLEGAAMANGIFNFFSDRPHGFNEIPILKGLVLLMSDDVDVDIKGEGLHKTPLFVATMYNAGKAISKLVDRGANMEEIGFVGCTPLQFAAFWGSEESCKVLLQNGANIDAQDKQHGNTALMYAIADAFDQARINSQIRIVKMLLEAGADTTITNKSGETAFEYANRNEYYYYSHRPWFPEWKNYRQQCGKIIKTHELRMYLHSYKLPKFLVNFFVFLVFAFYSLFKK